MAKEGVFQVPDELKDEDKWFRYFDRKQAVILGITLFFDYRLVLLGSEKGFLLVAIIVGILLTLLVVGSIMIVLPIDSLFLEGGGITIDQWILRILIRRRDRVIYVKNFIDVEDIG